MTEMTTRGGAMATAIVGTSAVVTGSVAAGNAPVSAVDDHSFGMARRGGAYGQMSLSLRVIAADHFKLVGGWRRRSVPAVRKAEWRWWRRTSDSR
jgi:hypothetical protein